MKGSLSCPSEGYTGVRSSCTAGIASQEDLSPPEPELFLFRGVSFGGVLVPLSRGTHENALRASLWKLPKLCTKFVLTGVVAFFCFALVAEMDSRRSLGVELTLMEIAFLA